MKRTPWKIPGPGDRNLFLNRRVIRFEFVVCEGPIDPYAFTGVHLEVALMKTKEDPGKVYGTTTDTAPGIVVPQFEGVVAANQPRLLPS